MRACVKRSCRDDVVIVVGGDNDDDDDGEATHRRREFIHGAYNQHLFEINFIL